MFQKTIGFIGGGRITRIILAGWERAGQLPKQLVVSDPSLEVLNRLHGQFPAVTITQDNYLAAGADIVVLSVHPPAIEALLQEVKSVLQPEAIMVSLTPKVTFAKLRSFLGGFERLVRMNPNAPSIVNHGLIPVAYANSITAADRAEVDALFGILGFLPEVAESKIEAYAILTAMGPTYLWYQLYELLQLGRNFGLTDEELQVGLTKMLEGTVRTMFDSGLEPAEVMDLVPVKPMANFEPAHKTQYHTKLMELYQILKS